jgi:hypothetical protein
MIKYITVLALSLMLVSCVAIVVVVDSEEIVKSSDD